MAISPWPATDHLGRSLPTHADTGPVQKDRHVGIFYFLWLGAHSNSGPHDLSKILKTDPPKMGKVGHFHHWGEPELGYYFSRDPFVLRRHATQLTDAGIDFVALDVTNAVVYQREVDALCKTWLQMRAEGLPTPQITFLTNTKHVRTTEKLFNRIYQKDLYRDLWFTWQGKPLLMSNPEGLSATHQDFFTLRRSWAWTKGHPWFGDGQNRWPWLDHTPQTPGWREKGQPEFLPVAVAQHPISNIGRSHQNKTQPAPSKTQSNKGLYFQEQWNHALKVDPEIVFITGWNEWVAQRSLKKEGIAPNALIGKPLKPGDSFFVDCYTLEFSRDIEPMSGGYQDAYYYQMISNIRRFKGTPSLPVAHQFHEITIDGKIGDWEKTAAPIFTDTTHDTTHRDHPGWGANHYTDQSGRNDFSQVRIASQADSIAILIETENEITSRSDDRWINLYLDADQNPATGWHGYDYLINRSPDANGMTSLEKLQADGSLSEKEMVPCVLAPKLLEIKIPILPEWQGKTCRFDFHLTDNSPRDSQFFLQGDHAPNRRFNYRYTFSQ